MKKLVCILVCLMAVPALALDVSLVQVGDDVEVQYSGADVNNLPRAFALTVSIAGGGLVDSVTPTLVGEGAGFGIFPGTIVIDVNGDVTDFGTPVAPASDPGASGTGLGTASVVLELGSLYDTNAPAASGTIAVIGIDCDGATGDLTVSAAAEPIRGGIVTEDGNSVAVTIADLTYDGCASAPTCWDITECAGQPSGDANCDGGVNISDLVALKASWFKSTGQAGYNCCADFDQSGSVNITDLVILKANWFTSGYTPSNGVTACP